MFVEKLKKVSHFFFLNRKSTRKFYSWILNMILNKYFIIIGIRIEVLNDVCREIWKKFHTFFFFKIENLLESFILKY